MRSLRDRMLWPLASVACATAIGIGICSYWIGDRVARRQLDDRFHAIEATLSSAPFPLTASVLTTVQGLSGAELATFSAEGRRLASTFDDQDTVSALRDLGRRSPEPQQAMDPPEISGYRARWIELRRPAGSADGAKRLLVLFDDRGLRLARWQAAFLPLVTGLSTMLFMSIVAWSLARRLITRIAQLRVQVQRIAAGDFTSTTVPAADDELGELNVAMQQMGQELSELWRTLRKREQERLIHLLAAGLAHQMRNSLTGARMAVELHSQKCVANQDEGLVVALREMERAEEHVRRILVMAAEQEHDIRPGRLGDVLSEIKPGLNLIAKHQRLELEWLSLPEADRYPISDCRALGTALQNLVLNGLQAGGDRVVVEFEIEREFLTIHVRDNGPGPPALDQADIFDAFVTTKPEGMGLGLALVRQSVERLNGQITWRRHEGLTEFRMTLGKTTPGP